MAVAHSTTFEAVARLVCTRVGWSYSALTTDQWEMLREEVSAALRWAWESWWWPQDLEDIERITLRSDWDATTTYAAADEVYHADSDGYYVALQASTNQVPATYASDTWTTAYTYWARVEEEADVETGEWESGAVYALGDRVDWHDTTYCCITAHTSSDLILPSNATYWGEYPGFDWTVAYAQAGRTIIGRVHTVTELDPRENPASTPFEFSPSKDGIRFLNLTVNRPWVKYRVRCPSLDGDAYSASTSYTGAALTEAVWGYDVSTTATLYLTDTVTGTRYSLTIADGQLTLTAVS